MSQAAVVLHSDSANDDSGALALTASPAESAIRYKELQAFVQAAMVPGVDYMVIPGTGKKPSLLQPGAQKLCELYGFAVSFTDVSVTEEWEKGFFAYRKKCALTARRDGRFIADGVGSCNSKEDKYAGRWVDAKKVPPNLDKAQLKTRTTQYGPQCRVPNDEIFSQVNTIEKMACKRALIHAVIGATRSAGLFTQDVEDLPKSVFGVPDAERSFGKAPSTPHDPETGEVIEGAPLDTAASFTGEILAAKDKAALAVIGRRIAQSSLTADEKAAVKKTYGEKLETFQDPASAALRDSFLRDIEGSADERANSVVLGKAAERVEAGEMSGDDMKRITAAAKAKNEAFRSRKHHDPEERANQ